MLFESYITYVQDKSILEAEYFSMVYPIIILDMEIRNCEMYPLVVFNDNSVDYIHYKELRVKRPFTIL